MRPSLSLLALLALSAAPLSQAVAAPILPNQDKAGALLSYQRLAPPDRLATMEAFAKRKISAGTFNTLDACALRQTTEPSAGSARISATFAVCSKEAGL